MSPVVHFIVILSGTVFLRAFVAEATVQCYVCSWQKPTPGLMDFNDTCSHHNFKEEYASIVDCSEGCEAVTYRHSNKDEIIHFSRNCLNVRNKQGGSDICYNRADKIEYQSICACHSKLCNGSIRFVLKSWMYLGFVALLIIMN